MLKKRQTELIEFIYAQRNVSSSAIASHFQISKRTVINDVKEINEFFPGPNLILSNSKGYYLDPSVFSEIRMAPPELVTLAPDERLPFLAHKFLSSYGDKLDIYDTSLQLYFSGSTIRTDLYKLREIVRDYGLDIQLTYNSASLIGPELKKREFFFSFLHEALRRNVFDFSQLDRFFPQFNCARVYKILTTFLEKHKERMSDYEFVCIFYRLLIGMCRIAHAHFITEPLYLLYVRKHDIALVKEVVIEIERWDGLTFPECEVKYLTLVFAAINIHSNLPEDVTPESLSVNLWPDCYTLVEEIVDGIRKHYDVDLRETPSTYVDFALHIRSLIRRLHAGIRVKNPYQESIKYKSPVAFDSAVYAASMVRKHCSLNVSEEDIACLALCLGHCFERDFDEAVKINVLFVLPSYFNVDQSLYQYYKERLSFYIGATNQVSSLDACEDLSTVDIVISTLNLQLREKRFVQIGPVGTASDYRRLYSTVCDLHHEKMLRNFSALLQTVTDGPHFFHVSGGFPSKEATLEYMESPLLRDGIISEEFCMAVLEQESFSDTRLGQVALPRTIEIPASEDTLSLLITDTPIPWGKGEVRAIILFTAESGHYAAFCLKVLRRLTHILERKENLQRLLQCRSWQDFTALML